MYPHIRIIQKIRDELLSFKRRTGTEGACTCSECYVEAVVPHWWREEAATMPDWFCRTCRGLGIQCTYDLIHQVFRMHLQ